MKITSIIFLTDKFLDIQNDKGRFIYAEPFPLLTLCFLLFFSLVHAS